MTNGFIALHRSFVEWEWYNEPNVMRLFLHLILKANHKDKKWRGVLVKRGQTVVSLEKLSSELSLSVQQIRTAIKKLKSTGEITSESTNSYTLVTLVNYDKYQKRESKATNETTSDITNEQQTSNKRITTNNNDNNDNNDNNINNMAAQYSILLNKNGVRTTPSNPELINWASQKVSLAELSGSIKKALKANPGRKTPAYIGAIIFNTRAKESPGSDKADLAWEKLYSQCICSTKLISEAFEDDADFVKEVLKSGVGQSIYDLKMNTVEYNKKVIRKQFVNAYRQMS